MLFKLIVSVALEGHIMRQGFSLQWCQGGVFQVGDLAMEVIHCFGRSPLGVHLSGTSQRWSDG